MHSRTHVHHRCINDALRTVQGHTGYVASVAFSPDGARLASASKDETVRIWDVSTGQAIATLQVHMPTLRLRRLT